MSVKVAEATSKLVDRALAGEADAVRSLVDLLAPVVQARVARALLHRRSAGRGRGVRQEIEDTTQDVFVALFESNGKALRAWKSERGLSLQNFVGLLAEREVASIFRSGRRSPWTEDPTMADELALAAGEVDGPEGQIGSRELFSALLERLRAELTPRGLQLFYLVIVEERSVEDVCATTGMNADAVYAWRSRLGKLVRKLASEIQSESPASA